MEFVEHPSAISIVSAFINASFVIISLGRISLFNISITAYPALFARRILSEYTAGIVPFPLSPIPRTSVRQFIEFAVYIPEHEPHVGQVLFSNSITSSSLILPATYAPTASNILESDVFFPLTLPESIGPPDTNTVGILSLAAAISIPGTVLSQFGIITSASN